MRLMCQKIQFLLLLHGHRFQGDLVDTPAPRALLTAPVFCDYLIRQQMVGQLPQCVTCNVLFVMCNV